MSHVGALRGGALPRTRPPTPDEREQLALLREAFQHATGVQDWHSNWWDRLTLPDRRLLLAFCALDDSEESARRSWPQLLLRDRDLLVGECRRFARLLRPLGASRG